MCQGDTKRRLTWEQLAQHNKRTDAFVAVRGKVYNVTEFMKKHPGGQDALIVAAGRDVTQVFEMYHPFSTAKVLAKYEVGEVLSNNSPSFPSQARSSRPSNNVWRTTLSRRSRTRSLRRGCLCGISLSCSPSPSRGTLNSSYSATRTSACRLSPRRFSGLHRRWWA
eukprot:Opistho-1_new@78079